MKKLLTFIAFGMILPMLVFSCGDNDVIIDSDDKEITGGNDNDSTSTDIEPINFWDENNFQPLNDEFNDFREFQAGLWLPYDLSNQKVCNYFNSPNEVTTREISERERTSEGLIWIEVTYPKEDPSKVEYSVYGIITRHTGWLDRWFSAPFKAGAQISDDYVLRTLNLYKDSDLIATIDHLPHRKYMINMNDTSLLLYDYHRVALAANDMLYYDDTTDTQTTYTYQELRDKIIDSNKPLEEYYFAKDPYGGKVLGVFGSLTSFLLPVNGPCADGMVQEVIGLREGPAYDAGMKTGFTGNHFLYRNFQSPAVPYLPESILDLKGISLVRGFDNQLLHSLRPDETNP